MEIVIPMDSRGRMSLPINIRKELKMDKGGELVVRCENGILTMTTKQQQVHEHIKKLQSMVNKKLPDDISLADELIAERRAEAKQETAKEF